MRIFKIGPGGAPGAAGAPGKKKRQCTIFKLNYNSLYYLFQVLLAHLVQQDDADEEKHKHNAYRKVKILVGEENNLLWKRHLSRIAIRS